MKKKSIAIPSDRLVLCKIILVLWIMHSIFILAVIPFVMDTSELVILAWAFHPTCIEQLWNFDMSSFAISIRRTESNLLLQVVKAQSKISIIIRASYHGCLLNVSQVIEFRKLVCADILLNPPFFFRFLTRLLAPFFCASFNETVNGLLMYSYANVFSFHFLFVPFTLRWCVNRCGPVVL